MKHHVKRLVTGFVILSLLLFAPITSESEAAYTAPTDLIRVAIYTTTSSGAASTKTFPCGNLQNVSSCGYGYDFGYYDGRTFVSLGVSVTDTDKITMMIDRNMSYNASYTTETNSYTEGTSGSVVVGCYHIRLNTVYSSYSAAKQAADASPISAVNTFIRYENGSYVVLGGAFTSSADASNCASAIGVTSYSIDNGSKYTVTVVETGTYNILFEFDCGTTYSLAVRPRSTNGEKTLTYFKGNQYYGDFVYNRSGGEYLTIINYVNIEDYVKGVLPSEMGASWPLEALKAGAVCARTYAMSYLNKHASLGFDLCNTIECQVYYGRRNTTTNSDAAVEATAGQYLTYDGALCETYYYSCNGGASEDVENVWDEEYPYLRGVQDPYEAAIADNISNYSWTKTFTGEELAAKLQSKGYNCSTIVKFEITKFTDMGNVYKITLTDSNGKMFSVSKDKARTFLGLRSLRYTVAGATATGDDAYYVNSSEDSISSLNGVYAIGSDGTAKLSGGTVYAITGTGNVEAVDPSGSVSSSGNSFVIKGTGYGHNVGLSQWGAYSMAKYFNKSYIDILTFYYTGTEVTSSK